MQPKSTLCMSHQMTFTGRACLATCGGSGPQMWPRSTSSMQLKPTRSVAAAVVTMCSPCLPPALQPSSPHLGARLHTRGILAAFPSMPASATDCQLHSHRQHQIEGQRVKPASSTPLVYHPVASLPSLAQAAAVLGMLRPRQCTWCGAHLDCHAQHHLQCGQISIPVPSSHQPQLESRDSAEVLLHVLLQHHADAQLAHKSASLQATEHGVGRVH